MPLGAAHAADDDAIPPDLRAWIPWVLSQRGEDVCTKLDGMPRCQWPGRLQLDLTSRGGEFQLEVFVETKGLVRLPGDTKSWPSEVRDGANELPILAQDELPVVELAAGAHTLRGQFAWRHLPETLSIGPHDAFVELTLEKRAVPLPKREGGELWLKGLDDAGSTSGEPEHLELDVFRKIHDGVPLVIESRLVFQVAGRAREIEFRTPLLPGTLPLSVSGDLAAALGRDGALRVQLTPGRHELIVVARSQGVPAQLDSPTRSAPWPEQETWVFEPNSALRAVELSGPPGIDASRTVLPEEWKQLAAFAVTPGQALALRTTRRGEPEIPPNRLTLRRELWLDDDAGGFTVRDDLSGTVQRDWRLDLLEGQLGQVRVGSEAQVITLAKDGTHRGVELREAALALRAVSRMPHQNELRAVGWSTNVDSLTATLHLPAGWDVLATSGVDEVQDTWIRRWDLFAVFYVLVLTLATAKLVGVPAGLVAFVTLVLCHDYDAPHYIWSVLLVLAALIGLVRAPRFAWVLRWSFRATSLTLAVMLLTFAVEQVRYALYPHLRDSYSQAVDESSKEGGSGARADVDRPEEAMAESAPPAAPAPVATEAAQELDSLRSMGRLGGSHASKRAATSSSSNYGSAPAQKQFQPGSIVQTGPGVPDVVSSSWELSWSGPVTSEHTIRLYLAPPWFMRLTTALRLVASGLLAYLFWRYAASRRPAPDSDAPPSHGSPSTDAGTPEAGVSMGAVSEGASSANTPSAGTPIDAGTVRTTASVWASCLLLLGTWLAPGSASAAEPSDERLAQLTERLTQPAACTPNCLSIGRAKLRVQGSQLSYRAQAHAGDRVAYRLPGPAHALGAVELLVDGRATHDVRLEPDGAYYVRLTPGVHEVELRATPDTDRLTLELGAVPHYLEVDSSDWVVTGVNDDGKVEGGTLTLARKLEPSQGETRATETRAQVVVPPWFTVARQLSIGVNGRVQTRVVRTSDPTSPEVLELPLLPGEQVTTPGIETRGGVAVLSFSREITEREFASTLPLTRTPARRFELSLLAPAQAPYSEIWRIECGIVWHCSASGLPTTSHVEGGRYLETYAPWPGEKLELIAEEPRSAPGQSLTIDSATLTISPGPRLAKSRLELSLRTSHSPIHGVRIPASALLESVTLDGQEQSAKNEAGLVRVALRPGSHRLVVEWQENTGLTTSFRSSSVDLGAEATNFRTSIQIPADRWLLAAGGPGYGPAILFWGYLVLIVVAAFLLPLVPGSRLRHYQWLLLGLGLTQVPALVAVSIVGWFFFVEGRARYWAKTQRFKNFLQLVLIGGTVLFLVALTGAVYQGLVFSPDMEIAGSDSYAGQLSWYVDRSPSSTQPVWFVSTSLWAWRAVMLVWALWLARSLLDWLRWAWTVAHQDGFWAEPSATGKRGGLWRFFPGRADATAGTAAEPTAGTTAGAGEAAGASDAAPAGTPVPEAGEDPEAAAPPDGPS